MVLKDNSLSDSLGFSGVFAYHASFSEVSLCVVSSCKDLPACFTHVWGQTGVEPFNTDSL